MNHPRSSSEASAAAPTITIHRQTEGISKRTGAFGAWALIAVTGSLAVLRAGVAVDDRPPSPVSARPNVLLIITEDHGPDFGCYGDHTVPTPHVDRLAAQGVLFRNAYTTQSVCSPARASILTGLYPHQHGQIGLASSAHNFTMVHAWPNLAGILRSRGYRTGIIGKLHVNPASAFPFDRVLADAAVVGFARRDVAKTATAAGEFMNAGEAPFFLMVNLPDAHLPFLKQDASGIPAKPVDASVVTMPRGALVDSPRLRVFAAGYYNCISRIDTAIGLLLGELERSGRMRDTLMIWLSDHGAQFSRGKVTSYEFAIRIPCVISWPGGIDRPQVRQELVSTIDLLPTVLHAVGVETPAGLSGRSLLPLLRGESVPWRDCLFTEWNTSHAFPAPSLYFPQRTVRDARYKLIVNLMSGSPNPTELYYTSQALINTGATADEISAADAAVRAAFQTWREAPPVELYDLENDPFEMKNLAGHPALAEVQSRLERALAHWRRETKDPLLNPDNLRRLADEHFAQAAHRQDRKNAAKPYLWQYPGYFAASARE